MLETANEDWFGTPFMSKTHTYREAAVIFWDYDGTILDDVSTCVNALNSMLRRRNLAEISMERYTEIFDFPIVTLYKGIGFDLANESFMGQAILNRMIM